MLNDNKNVVLGCVNIEKKYGATETVVLFANARDEKHIREWATHHLLLGFDKIIIFDHKSVVPLKQIFNGFDEKIQIVNVSQLANPIKRTLMKLSVSMVETLKADWMIYLDADEFLILNDKNMNVKQFLDNYTRAHSVAVNWLMFGSNNLTDDPNGLILENYTKSELILHALVKTFVRPNEILRALNPHFFNIKNNSYIVDVNKKQMTPPYYARNPIKCEFNKVSAYIAHYATQSEETFRNRKLRPMDDTGNMKFAIDYDVTKIHARHNVCNNFYPKNAYAERVRKYLLERKCTF